MKTTLKQALEARENTEKRCTYWQEQANSWRVQAVKLEEECNVYKRATKDLEKRRGELEHQRDTLIAALAHFLNMECM